MSNSMDDIRDVCDLITRTAGDIGMNKDDLSKAKDLVQRYGDKRAQMMEEMLKLLRKSDTSDIVDVWKSGSESAGNMLRDLNQSIPRSPMGEGLEGVGAKDFFQGEEIVWKESAKGEIPFRADVMCKVLTADLELIRQCSESLKNVNNDDKVVDQLIKENLGGIKSDLTEVTKAVTKKLVEKTLTSWMKEGDAKAYFKKWLDTITKMLEQNIKNGQQKAALKQTVLQTIELINKTKDKLSEEWIEKMHEEGVVFARNLHEMGEHSYYKATDWKAFGEDCIKELDEWRNHAKEVSKQVFNEILPQFLQKDSKDFAAFTNDPSWLASWKSDMRDNFKSLYDAVTQEDADMNKVADGSYIKAARDTFDQVRSMITAGERLYLDKGQSAEDQMKK